MRLMPVLLFTFALTSPAYAYIGPGAGLGTVGTVLAFFAAILLLLVGFVWYPLRRILRRSGNSSATQSDK